MSRMSDVLDPRTRISTVLTARMFDWLVAEGLSEISIRQAEEATEQHGIVDVWGAISDLVRRDLLVPSGDAVSGSHKRYTMPAAVRYANVNLKAGMYLEALTKVAHTNNNYPTNKKNSAEDAPM